MVTNRRTTPVGINFRYEASAQDRRVETAKIQAATDGFARVLVRDVALRTSSRFYKSARNTFMRHVERDVLAEIRQMATMVRRFISQPQRATGPSGILTPAAKGVAETTRALGRSIYYDLQDSNAYWPERSLKYMRQKQSKYGHQDWWRNTGQLLRVLSDHRYYIRKFGPVAVQFIRTNNRELEKPITTLPGAPGRASKTFTVGRLEVITFGKITPAMLPSLASGDVNDATPSGGSYLPELLGGRTGQKLMGFSTGELGATPSYRPVLEPFLSYYLTRAIPNAVFRRVEKQFGRDSRDNPGLGI